MKLKTPLPTRRQRILVADDIAAVSHVIARILAGDGFAVDVVSDGEAAWEKLREKHYDLLVTYQDMPRLKGVQLIERMRQAGMNLPVILVSGQFHPETLPVYPQLNLAAVMSKPFNFLEIIHLVRRALGLPDAAPAPATGMDAPVLASRFNVDAPAPAAVAGRILIADDDDVVRGSLAAVLQSEGYTVDEAADGLEAVTRALQHKPDLVLLDLNMPHADGWTAFKQLDQVTPLLPIIIITARPNQYPEAVRVGVDAFMEKPLNIPMLVSAVKQLTHEEEGRHVRRITNRAFVTRLLASALA